MLYPEDFDSLRAAYCKLRLRVVGFSRNKGTDYKTPSYRDVLEITRCEHVAMIIRQRRLWLAGALARRDKTVFQSASRSCDQTHKGPRRLAGPPNTGGTASRRT
ncbi:unnamed protein product [Sphacelaria rigidula]